MVNYSFPRFEDKVIDKLKSSQKVIIIGHKKPDGDCYNSQLAMNHLMKELGCKEVILANAGPFERAETKPVEHLFTNNLTDEMLSNNPLLILVDCGELSRIGDLASQVKDLDTVVLDHHKTSLNQGWEYSYIFPESTSTTLIIEKLFQQLNIEITEEVASWLFFGFATDSGFFRFVSPFNGEAIRMAGDLVQAGANPSKIASMMSGGRTLRYIQNTSLLVNRTTFVCDNQVALTFFKSNDEGECPSDNYYRQIMSITGVKAVILFKESSTNIVELGLRANFDCNFDMSQFALRYGGGGHIKASGATIKGSFEEVVNMVTSDIKRLF